MIAIATYLQGKLHDQAEAEDGEAALLAAQTLWDEMPAAWGSQREVRITCNGTTYTSRHVRPHGRSFTA